MTTSSSENASDKIHGSISSFVEGLNGSIEDITALEVNTMVVSDITGLKFNAQVAYRLLFEIPNKDIKDTEIMTDQLKLQLQKPGSEQFYEALCSLYDQEPYSFKYPNLTTEKMEERIANEPDQKNREIFKIALKTARKNHLKLRERLEERAKSIPLEKTNELNVIEDHYLPTLPTPAIPLPDDLKKLIQDKEFIQVLRKLHELRSLIEKGESADPNNVYDNIYAQTTIQIDGDIINAFNKRLFEQTPETRDFLIKVHQDAVNTGQKNWQSLLHLIVDMLSQIPKMFPQIK